MQLSRWEPFGNMWKEMNRLQREMNRLFSSPVGRGFVVLLFRRVVLPILSIRPV